MNRDVRPGFIEKHHNPKYASGICFSAEGASRYR
jgi:hypothetical protein